MEELESYNGTTLSLGSNLASPSPGQRVITHEAAGMKKLWESYEKAMKKYSEATLGIWHPVWQPATRLAFSPRVDERTVDENLAWQLELDYQ